MADIFFMILDYAKFWNHPDVFYLFDGVSYKKCENERLSVRVCQKEADREREEE